MSENMNDAVENQESTSSDINAEIENQEIEQPNIEESTAPAEESDASTGEETESSDNENETLSAEKESTTDAEPERKPRQRKTNARKLQQLEERLADLEALPGEPARAEQTASPQAEQQRRGLQRKQQQLMTDVDEMRRSSDKYDQDVAKSVDDIVAHRSPLSFISSQTFLKLLDQGLSADEIHELNTNYADKITPTTPDVEERQISKYLFEIRNPKQKARAAKKSPPVVKTIKGSGASVRERDVNYWVAKAKGQLTA